MRLIEQASRLQLMRKSLGSGGITHMRQVLYRVATSVDGYIAGPHGEFDWIVHDPTINLSAVYDTVGTVLLGRRTYEADATTWSPPWPAGWHIYVFSRTLVPQTAPSRHDRQRRPRLCRRWSTRRSRPGDLALWGR